MKSELDKNND